MSDYQELVRWLREWIASGYWGPLGCPQQLPKVADAMEGLMKDLDIWERSCRESWEGEKRLAAERDEAREGWQAEAQVVADLQRELNRSGTP